MADSEKRSSRIAKKCAHVSSIIIKQELRARMKQVNQILKKPAEERTKEELIILDQSPDISDAVQKRTRNRQLAKERTYEIEDPEDLLQQKCKQLAEAIRCSKKLVIYTGAGISTAASIPDYRGPNGVWTLLQKGLPIKAQDLSDAEPTFTHMSITRLFEKKKVKHVLSQNCDGLHLRSGYPRHKLSEVHGNMFIEICKKCKPPKEHIRLFDVTERTAMRRHGTGRMCKTCGKELQDTIIHFGEKAPLHSPYNWKEAAAAVDTADLILCLGTSLKVLKKYGCLWNLHKPQAKRPKLYIANLQWTPKDDSATLKINGKCDRIMELVMSHLGFEVPEYKRTEDPIFDLAVELVAHETDTTTKKILNRTKCLTPFNSGHHEQPLIKEAEKREHNSNASDNILGKGQSYTKQDSSEVPLIAEDVTEEESPKLHLTAPEVQVDPVKTSSQNKTGNTTKRILHDVQRVLDEEISPSLNRPVNDSQPLVPLDQEVPLEVKTEVISETPGNSQMKNVDLINPDKTSSDQEAVCLSVPKNDDDADLVTLNDLAQFDTSNSSVENKPSDKYKLIKFLLNKPADVTCEKLKLFTEKLREMCDSVSLGDIAVSNDEKCIYTTAKGQKEAQLIKTTVASDPVPKNGASADLDQTYPTLVGALKGLVQESQSVSNGTQPNSTDGNLRSILQKGLLLPPNTSNTQLLEPLHIDVGPASSTGRSSETPPHDAISVRQRLDQGGLLKACASSSESVPISTSVSIDNSVSVSPSVPPAQNSILGTMHQLKRNMGLVDNVTDTNDEEQAENISPGQSGSAPGWFGKGLHIRKKRKKSR